jgi:hypothetical protein
MLGFRKWNIQCIHFLKKCFRSFFSRAHWALLVAKRANMTINKVLQEKNMGIENAELKAILNLLKG